MKEYRGYFLYYIKKDMKSVKQYNFRNFSEAQLRKMHDIFATGTRYIYKGSKIAYESIQDISRG